VIKDPCTRCGIRWRQCWSGEYAGLCRHCAIEVGAVLPSAREIEAERVTRARASLQARRVPDSGPRPSIEKVINGTTFLVVWDGS